MIRAFISGLVVIFGAAGVYWLMMWNTHFLLFAAFGSVCGSMAGGTAWGRNGWYPGAALGFILPLIYLPLWFLFDLPPTADIDL